MQRILAVLTAFSVQVVCLQATHAQIAFGVVQQNGVVSGGSLSIGGTVNPGRTGVRLGVGFGTSQLIGIQQFSVPGAFGGIGGGGGGFGGSVAQTQPPPSLFQFLRATHSFDADENALLSQEELMNVAVALIKEMRQRNGTQRRPLARTADADNGEEAESPPLDEETKRLAQSFVARAMKFDRDKDRSLDQDETKRMARVFLKTLG